MDPPHRDVTKYEIGIGNKVSLMVSWFSTFIAGLVICLLRDWLLTLFMCVLLPFAAIVSGVTTRVSGGGGEKRRGGEGRGGVGGGERRSGGGGERRSGGGRGGVGGGRGGVGGEKRSGGGRGGVGGGGERRSGGGRGGVGGGERRSGERKGFGDKIFGRENLVRGRFFMIIGCFLVVKNVYFWAVCWDG